jgi:hypothetical protein
MFKGIDMEQFQQNSDVYWEREKTCNWPRREIEVMFHDKESVLFDFYENVISDESLTNTQIGKKRQLLETILKQFTLYEEATHQESNTQAFNKLPSLRKIKKITIELGNCEDFVFDDESYKADNKLVMNTKDFKQAYFTSIPGLREEVKKTLDQVNSINVENVLDNDKQKQCKSFGTHHIFEWYIKQTKGVISGLNLHLSKRKTDTYNCVCGSEDLKKNGKSKHDKSKKHIMFMGGIKDNAVLLCQPVEMTVEIKELDKCEETVKKMEVDDCLAEETTVAGFSVEEVKQTIERTIPVFETDLKNEIIGPCIVQVQEPVIPEFEKDDDDDDEEEEEEEEEEEDEEETEVMRLLNDKKESNEFDKLLVDIRNIEQQKLSDEEKEDCEYLSDRGRRDDETQYHLILESDADILRRRKVIHLLVSCKKYDIRPTSKLHEKIEKMIDDRVFNLFITIKSRYDMIPPTLQYFEKFGKQIHNHPRINELFRE